MCNHKILGQENNYEIRTSQIYSPILATHVFSIVFFLAHLFCFSLTLVLLRAWSLAISTEKKHWFLTSVCSTILEINIPSLFYFTNWIVVTSPVAGGTFTDYWGSYTDSGNYKMILCEVHGARESDMIEQLSLSKSFQWISWWCSG